MFLVLLKKIGHALETHGFPYMVIGGQADVRLLLKKNPQPDESYILPWLNLLDEALAAEFAERFRQIQVESRGG